MRYFRNLKPLSKTAFYLIILVSLVGAFFIVTDKREVILIYVSVALIATLHFLVHVLKERNVLQKTWQYNFARFLSLYLPSSLFFGCLPSLQDSSLGVRLIIGAIVAGIALAGIHFQESFQRNCGD